MSDKKQSGITFCSDLFSISVDLTILDENISPSESLIVMTAEWISVYGGIFVIQLVSTDVNLYFKKSTSRNFFSPGEKPQPLSLQ